MGTYVGFEISVTSISEKKEEAQAEMEKFVSLLGGRKISTNKYDLLGKKFYGEVRYGENDSPPSYFFSLTGSVWLRDLGTFAMDFAKLQQERKIFEKHLWGSENLGK
jgi:hypothetical protein